MTSKEKANKLIERFHSIANEKPYFMLCEKFAMESALICLDELANTIYFLGDKSTALKKVDFYKEVKQEIQNQNKLTKPIEERKLVKDFLRKTKKELAEHLLYRFTHIPNRGQDLDFLLSANQTKEATLICIDELINAVPRNNYTTRKMSKRIFYREVEQELKRNYWKTDPIEVEISFYFFFKTKTIKGQGTIFNTINLKIYYFKDITEFLSEFNGIIKDFTVKTKEDNKVNFNSEVMNFLNKYINIIEYYTIHLNSGEKIEKTDKFNLHLFKTKSKINFLTVHLNRSFIAQQSF